MKRLLASVLLMSTILAGCSSRENEQAGQAESSGDGKGPLVAYGYTYRFTLPAAAISEVQDRHMALCDRMGAGRCRMLEMRRTTTEGRSDGSTRFVVLAGEARKFGQDITAPVAALGGELSSREFEAEDVTGQTAEAAAKVGEKNNSDNRAAAAALRERVETSTVWAYYTGSEGFWTRVGAALGSGGETLTASIVALIYFLAGAFPWVIVLGALFLVARAIARRIPRRDGRAPVVDRPAEQAAGPGA
ncbi:MAG: hypothetical protein ABW173_11355 [Sphingomonas sp.]